MSRGTKWFLIIILILAVVGIGLTVLFLTIFSGSMQETETTITGGGDRIAVVDIRGVITSSEEAVRQLKKYRDDRTIKAILLHVDSPGGGVVPSQEIYETVRRIREGGKLVVVSMGSLAASGGYYIACGGSRLVANRGTLTGSIGVISEFLQFGDALGKIGVEIKTIKAGKLKDAGSPVRKMTEEDRKYFQGLMDDVHRQFIAVVERERDLEHAKLVDLADGRVFTGEQAVELGLVDTLGTYEDAVQIAAAMAGITGKPSIVRERKKKSFFDAMFGDVAEGARNVTQELLDRPVLSYRYNGPF